ncbi:CRISPR-associated endonuclease Cas2 [Peptoanaerobacter stomatis]
MQQFDLLEQDFEKYYFEDTFTIVIIYDIISNKRRTQLSKMLCAFGYRIQKSAFECILTKEKCELLLKKIDKFVKEEDLIRIYRLNQNVKITIYGKKLENENEPYYFI